MKRPDQSAMARLAIAGKTAALPKISKEVIDQFVQGPMTAEAMNAASLAFKKALIERALGVELGNHSPAAWKFEGLNLVTSASQR